MSVKSILLAGVGGQGIVRASDIISMALMAAGYDVKKSEVHGMAQRGGCVTSHVRYGEKVYSPISRKGEIDIMVSFEKMETLRYLDYMKKEGGVIINDEEIYPPSVNLGREDYPAQVEEIVRKFFNTVKILKATEIAQKVGNFRTANSVMIGALSPFLDVEMGVWDKVFSQSFPEKLVKVNLEAFQIGRNA